MQTPCGFNPEENPIQNIEEALAECSQCIKLSICGYPKTITFKAVKDALEDSPKYTTQQNLVELARECLSFDEFRYRVKAGDLPHRQTRNNPKDLLQIARSSMNFSDFHARASGGE